MACRSAVGYHHAEVAYCSCILHAAFCLSVSDCWCMHVLHICYRLYVELRRFQPVILLLKRHIWSLPEFDHRHVHDTECPKLEMLPARR